MMNEEQFDNVIRTSNRTPRPPDALVERMAARCTAIERGRLAEAELSRFSRQQSPDMKEQTDLAAQALTGQMAMLMPLPASPESVAHRLSADARFQKLAEQPVDKLLSDVRSGRMLKALSKTDLRNQARGEAVPAPQPEKGGIVVP